MALKVFGWLKIQPLCVFIWISFSVVSPHCFKKVRFPFSAVQMTAKPLWGHSYFEYDWLKLKYKNLHQTSKWGCVLLGFYIGVPSKRTYFSCYGRSCTSPTVKLIISKWIHKAGKLSWKGVYKEFFELSLNMSFL